LLYSRRATAAAACRRRRQLPARRRAQVGKGKLVKVTGIERAGRTATVLLRGSNKLVLEEAERSLHDALCVVRCLVHKRFLVPGGAAPEVEVGTQLARWAKTLVARPRASFVIGLGCGLMLLLTT